MANFLITPNMQMPNPVPGVDPGPDYATNLSNSLNILDGHNHSAGNGVLINPNGLNINAELPFNANNATLLRSARFSPQTSPLSLGTDLGCLYVSGVDLYYNDVNGNQVRITSAGTVNATSSGITSGAASAAFSGGVLVVKSTAVSGANVLMQSAQLTNSGNLTNILTLQAPTLSGSYSVTLPPLPSVTSFLQMDNTGNTSASVAVAGGITNTMLAPLNIQQSSSSGNFSGNVAFPTITPVTNLTVTITTSGRPVMLMLQAFGGGTNSAIAITTSDVTKFVQIFLFRDAANISNSALYAPVVTNPNAIPPAISYVDVPASGTYTYTVRYSVSTALATAFFTDCQLVAYEI
jgi:hypothetical protein